MWTSSCRSPLALAAVLASAAWAQESVIVKSAEPEWGFPADEKLVTAPLAIELYVDAEGKPVEVRSETPLPAAMMGALQQYELRPREADYGVALVLETKAPLRSYTGPANLWPVDASAVATEAGKLDAAKAAEWEARLTDDPGTIGARSTLVLWSAGQSDAPGRQMRARQVEWLVRHAPDADILRHPAAWIDPGSGPYSNPQAYIRIRQLWVDHFRGKPATAKSIGAAALFLRARDPGLAEDLLEAGGKMSYYAAPALGALYATHALSGGEFGGKARGLLAGSSDVRVLRGAWRALTDRQLHSLAGFDALCADVIRQLKAVQPGAPGDCSEREYVTTVAPTAVAAQVSGSAPVRVSAFEQSKARVKSVAPRYPPIARQALVQGKVIFQAIIGKDGKVKSLTYVSGHPMLRPAAEEAVRQWEYRPTILNGEAVEVATDIEVEFRIN